MMNVEKDYKLELANKKYSERISNQRKLEKLKEYWQEHNNVIVDEPFQGEIEEGTVISRENVTNKTGDGSITPKTHIYETSAYLDESKGTFVTEYAYAGPNQEALQSHVVRFGINTNSENYKDSISQLNKQKKAKKKIALSEKSTFNINKLNKELENIEVTGLEQEVLHKAVDYLSNTNNTATTVLIDVLDRGSLKSIHTAVLYKQNDDIILLDPNNPTFSGFLKSCMSELKICSTSRKESKSIYKSPNKDSEAGIKILDLSSNITGKELYQYRDCIDIAVKLAFSLNNTQLVFSIKDGMVDVGTTETLHNAIEYISNNQNISELVPKQIETHPFRVKNSSNTLESQKATWYVKVYERIEKILPSLNSLNRASTNEKLHSVKELLKQFINIVKRTDQNHHEVLKSLGETIDAIFEHKNIPLLDELKVEYIGELKYIEESHHE